MEDDATQPGQPVEPSQTPASADDAAALAERLRALEAETLALKEALKAKVEPAEAPQEAVVEAVQPDAAPQSDVEDVPVDYDAATLDKIDKLLSRYRLEHSRGNKDVASQYLNEAIALGPRCSLVYEVQGDDALSRRNNKEAMEMYAKAKISLPRNLSAEKKHADLVFNTSAKLATASVGNFETMASAKSATLLSVIVPGLGHLIIGEIPKGIAYMIFWLGSIIWTVLTPNGIPGLLSLLSPKPGITFNGVILVPIAIGIISWLAALLDINGRAKLVSRGIGKGSGPKPPVDLPF